ncbi:tripartite tricarboxylate transporter substrate-binding protein [Roseicella frigidaeris]|nr:tripartite tricarboxylate transporter substrate-binding protein [Roseicella frigidaeris]
MARPGRPLQRRTLLASGGALAPGAALAAWTPPGPIRLVVPFATGGGNDLTARLLAPGFGAALGQPVTVENHHGAAGTLGAGLVAHAPPDGATLLVDGMNQAVAPFLLPSPGFDYLHAFAPISQLCRIPLLLVIRADARFDSLAALLSRARLQPGRYAYASSGNGVANHVAAALLASRAGVSFTHSPYRGGAPALRAILGGEADFGFVITALALPLLSRGRLRALALSTAARLPMLPAVPSIAEQGFPGFDVTAWNGLFGPAGLAAEAIDRLYAACRAALDTAEARQRLAASGATALATAPATFEAFLRQERAAMRALVEAARIQAD